MSRREAVEKYERAKNKGEVDRDIIPLLDKINSSEHYYTTSSCSGRIILIELPEIGDKKNSRIIGKWHGEIKFVDLFKLLNEYKKGYLFLLVQSSIIHIVCDNVDNALKIIEVARDSSFKYSSIKSVKNEGILVEILGSENLNIPLGENSKIIVNEEELRFFVKISNMIIRKIKNKLKNFELNINSLLSYS